MIIGEFGAMTNIRKSDILLSLHGALVCVDPLPMATFIFKKNFHYSLIFSALVLSVSTAFASGGSRPDSEPVVAENPFIFSSGVSSDQADLLKLDLKRLPQLAVSTVDADAQSLFETSKISGLRLKAWLADRVQYVVGEDFDIESHISVVRPYLYSNSRQLPVLETPSADNPTNGNAKVVMSNIGTAVYLAGKMSPVKVGPLSVLLGLRLDNDQVVAMTSPRVGVLQIGEGLFMQRFLVNRDDPNAISNSLERLSTLFHEARHSDGNGKSVGFTHAVCPAGHAFAGYNACDRNTNGAYTVGAVSLRNMATNCTQCSVAEKEILKVRYLDSFDRVIGDAKWDARPEGRR